MVTLMSFGNSEGTRRCDAKCYDAEGGECDCICGGRNHGAGLQTAAQNTAEIAEGWLSEMAKRGDGDARVLLEQLRKPTQLQLL